MCGRGGAVYVMTGDGELQEGQIYEAFQTTAHQGVGLTVIVDHNKLQSDKPVVEITDLGDLAAKVRASGWEVARCDGHDLPMLAKALDHFRTLGDRPRLLIADTIKGRGVSFMEHPRALQEGSGIYRWHAGAPDDESFARAHAELVDRVTAGFRAHGLGDLELIGTPMGPKAGPAVTKEFVVEAYGRRLVELGARHPELVVLDGDLAADCRIRYFEEAYPGRFVENGIAEQDMVSMAGAMARHGLLPVVNSFATFLAARANEQIYNNVTEGAKVIYVCHFGGLVPAGPGPSHQSVRDISLFAALPGMTIVEPCNGVEAGMLLDWCVEQASSSCMLRLAIGPCPRTIALPVEYRPVRGQGILLREGRDLLAFAYGPVMLHELLTAAEALAGHGLSVAVANMPWLNVVDDPWLRDAVDRFQLLATVDDHASIGGLGDTMLRALARGDLLRDRRHWTFGCDDVPVCGTPEETLGHHGLDAASLARRLVEVARTRGFARAVGKVRAGGGGAGADAPVG
jgi:transketolase